MDKLSYEQLKGVDARFGQDVTSCFDYARCVETRTAKGGTSKKGVEEQIRVVRELLK